MDLNKTKQLYKQSDVMVLSQFAELIKKPHSYHNLRWCNFDICMKKKPNPIKIGKWFPKYYFDENLKDKWIYDTIDIINKLYHRNFFYRVLVMIRTEKKKEYFLDFGNYDICVECVWTSVNWHLKYFNQEKEKIQWPTLYAI